MTSATTTQLIDPRPVYDGATAWVLGLLRAVREDQQHLPSPCEEIDVRTLSSHLIGTVGRVIALAQTGDAETAAAIAPEHDADTFERLAAQAQQIWADDALLAKPVKAPWGEAEGRIALWCYANEALVHGWDLARALGRPSSGLDPDVAERALAFMSQGLTPENRGEAFAPEQPEPEGAGPYERLAAYAGRSVA